MELLEKNLLPAVNLFCYGQVRSAYGSGHFKKDLDEYFSNVDKIVTSDIKDKDSVYDSIKEFLGRPAKL